MSVLHSQGPDDVQKLKEQTYCVVYAGARLSLEQGDDPDAIRAEVMEHAGIGAADLGDPYFEEEAVSNVRGALEDALARRPPRYPRWFNREECAEWLEGQG